MLKQTKVAIGIHTRLSYANIWKLKSINGGKKILGKLDHSQFVPEDNFCH